MNLVDTHTHLYVEQFDPDRMEVVERAMKEGVNKFYIPAIDSTYYERMFDLRDSYPEAVRLMAGLHPTHVKEDYEKELEIVRELLEKDHFVAIGEIGIDQYWDKSFLQEQKRAFRTQIAWAKEKSLPIVIHARDSFPDIFQILDQEQRSELKGIFHCFTGTLEQAQRIVGYGFKLGIGGVVTFKNGGIDKFLNQIEIENLVLETDSPYLAPKPFRGKRNESSYLTHIVEKLSEIYEMEPNQIAEITTRSAQEIFNG